LFQAGEGGRFAMEKIMGGGTEGTSISGDFFGPREGGGKK